MFAEQNTETRASPLAKLFASGVGLRPTAQLPGRNLLPDTWGDQLGFFRRFGRLHANQPHHSSILMLQKMAMVDKGADRIRVAKIHSQFDAGILERFAVEVRNVYGVPQKRLVYGAAEIIQQHEVHLMNMERVEFRGSIFDDPIFHVSLLNDDVGNARARIERRWRLTIHG